jgi:CelD/BcsL family acetyltransferase involved in cellulose biosynthesis
MLAEAALELAPARFRLWSIDIDGRPISSLLFVAAGGTVSYWLGGFDPRWAALGPAIETVRAALEHAWALEDRLMDFGPGGQQYKYTFADSEDAVAQVDLLPRTSRFLRTRISLAPEYAVTRMKAFRHDAVRRLSPGMQQRLKAIRGRLRRFGPKAGR